MRKTTSGFALFEGIAVLAVVVIIGAVGYMAYNNFVAKPKVASTTAQTTSAQPVVIKSKADLDTAATQLDSLSVDDSDTTQLDSAINSF